MHRKGAPTDDKVRNAFMMGIKHKIECRPHYDLLRVFIDKEIAIKIAQTEWTIILDRIVFNELQAKALIVVNDEKVCLFYM